MNDADSTAGILSREVAVPDQVAIRDFEGETVALNVATGRYFGLNPVAATMLEALREAKTPSDAVGGLAARFEQPREVIERDLGGLVATLSERGLVELGPPPR